MPDSDPEPRGTPIDGRSGRTAGDTDDEDDADSPPESAPLGIKVVCVLAALSAGMDLYAGVGMLHASGPGNTVAAAVTVAVAVAQLGVLYGLWTLERWGYTGALAVFGVSTFVAAVTGALAVALLGGVVLAYVWSNREYYPRGSPADHGIDSPLDDIDSPLDGIDTPFDDDP